MNRTNFDVRLYARERKVYLIQIADWFDVQPQTITKWLGKELSRDRKEEFFRAIDEIVESR